MNIMPQSKAGSLLKVTISLILCFYCTAGVTTGHSGKAEALYTLKIKEWGKRKTDHKIFNSLLQKYVSTSGTVDYKGLKRDEKQLDQYLKILQNGLSGKSSEKEQLAFWINAYNAFTLKLVLDNYPVSSILDLHKGKPWEHRWIHIRGKTLSLDDIEHGIIRKEFKEPRIHFAVNCASRSCPPLQRKAFTSENLNDMLEKSTKAFINGNQNSISTDNLELSSIFKWYSSDFGDMIAFINRYSKVKVKDTTKITYKSYDWSLNEQ
jgi:hypothetical protein